MDECKPLPSTRLVAVSFLFSNRAHYQGLTLVHLSAQRQRFWWAKGYFGVVRGVSNAGLEGVLRHFGDVLSVRNGSG